MLVNQRFPSIFRIRQQRDFDRVYASEPFATDAMLVIRGVANQLPYSRLGLSVSRKVGNAVVRNRWKRLIREAFRRNREQLPAGFDFVVRPRRGAEPDFHAIAWSLTRLCHQLVERIARAK